MSPSPEGEEEWEEPSPPTPPFPPPPPWLLPPPPPMSPPPDPARACGVAIRRAGLSRGREVGKWREREGEEVEGVSLRTKKLSGVADVSLLPRAYGSQCRFHSRFQYQESKRILTFSWSRERQSEQGGGRGRGRRD